MLSQGGWCWEKEAALGWEEVARKIQRLEKEMLG